MPSTRTIPGPEQIEERSELVVADAVASEEDATTIDFAVTLDPASNSTVTVNYATEDGSAQAGAHYVAKSGTLTFNAGEAQRVVNVSLIDDDIEGDGETFALRLSNARRGPTSTTERRPARSGTWSRSWTRSPQASPTCPPSTTAAPSSTSI